MKKSILLMMFLLANISFARQSVIENKKFSVKSSFEVLEFELKLKKEKELSKMIGKKDFNFFSQANATKFLGKLDLKILSCIQWVYQGSATREQAAEVCRGVYDIECAQWVYQGSASREDAVLACRGVDLLECAEWVYQGSASREVAAMSCRGVTDMDCVKWVYQGSASREQSAESCSGGRRRPRRDHEDDDQPRSC